MATGESDRLGQQLKLTRQNLTELKASLEDLVKKQIELENDYEREQVEGSLRHTKAMADFDEKMRTASAKDIELLEQLKAASEVEHAETLARKKRAFHEKVSSNKATQDFVREQIRKQKMDEDKHKQELDRANARARERGIFP